MANPYLGELRTFAFGVIPKGWAPCNGQLLPVNQYQALFSILGTTYGGNGQTTFGLPNLMGAVPISSGGGYSIGQNGGSINVTLTAAQNPSHTHGARASTTPVSFASPSSTALLGPINNVQVFSGSLNSASALSLAAVTTMGGQPHPNLQPYQAVNICVAITGLFPSRN